MCVCDSLTLLTADAWFIHVYIDHIIPVEVIKEKKSSRQQTHFPHVVPVS